MSNPRKRKDEDKKSEQKPKEQKQKEQKQKEQKQKEHKEKLEVEISREAKSFMDAPFLTCFGDDSDSDDIVHSLNPHEAVIFFNSMLNPDSSLTAKQIFFFKQRDILDNILFAHRIFNHPCPQNRSSGDGGAFHKEVLKGADPITQAQEIACRTGVYHGYVYSLTDEGFRGTVNIEPAGLLGLTSRLKHITKEEVDTYLRMQINDRIRQAEEKKSPEADLFNLQFKKIVKFNQEPKDYQINRDAIGIFQTEKQLTAYWYEGDKLLHRSLDNSQIADLQPFIDSMTDELSKDHSFLNQLVSKYGCSPLPDMQQTMYDTLDHLIHKKLLTLEQIQNSRFNQLLEVLTIYNNCDDASKTLIDDRKISFLVIARIGPVLTNQLAALEEKKREAIHTFLLNPDPDFRMFIYSELNLEHLLKNPDLYLKVLADKKILQLLRCQSFLKTETLIEYFKRSQLKSKNPDDKMINSFSSHAVLIKSLMDQNLLTEEYKTLPLEKIVETNYFISENLIMINLLSSRKCTLNDIVKLSNDQKNHLQELLKDKDILNWLKRGSLSIKDIFDFDLVEVKAEHSSTKDILDTLDSHPKILEKMLSKQITFRHIFMWGESHTIEVINLAEQPRYAVLLLNNRITYEDIYLLFEAEKSDIVEYGAVYSLVGSGFFTMKHLHSWSTDDIVRVASYLSNPTVYASAMTHGLSPDDVLTFLNAIQIQGEVKDQAKKPTF